MHAVSRGCAIALAAAWLLASAQAQVVQKPAYRCGTRAQPTYSEVPCPGARQVGAPHVRTTDKWKAPPQDRALIARRSRLAPEQRQECSALDRRLAQERAMIKAKGDALTLQDEMPMVHAQKRFRELKC
jgi:hypothetical protein